MADDPSDQPVQQIRTHPVHLGRGATARPMPAFDGTFEWYDRYEELTRSDGAEGRLVSMHTFTASWETWEMHPEGHELVLCVSGTLTLHQEQPSGERSSIEVGAGEYVINEPGIWHTADVIGEATAVFVTAGWGTEVRGR